MVPRHLFPEVERVFITPGNYQSKVSVKSSKSTSSRRTKGRFSFGPSSRQDPKGVYLTEEELMHWNSKYALPEQQSRDIELAVESCIQHKSLLSLETLSSSKPNSCDERKIRSYSNPESLSLNRWIHWQTAQIPSRFIHHSSKSNKLRTILEFTDQLQMSPELSNAYELEMKAFLNADDVCGEENNVGMAEGRSLAKRRQNRRMMDSDEDEDFKTPQKKRQKAEDYEDSTGQLLNSPTGGPQTDHTLSDHSNHKFVHPPDSECSPHQSPSNDDITPPLSPPVIPKPPNLSSIDWLDDVTSDLSSQFSSVQQTPASCLPVPNQFHTFSATPSVGSSLLNLPKSPTFISPKMPLNSRKKSGSLKGLNESISSVAKPSSAVISKDIVSRPPTSGSTPMRITMQDSSINKFDDIPSELLFGDDEGSDDISEPSLIPESPEKPEISNHHITHMQHACTSSQERSPTPELPSLMDRLNRQQLEVATKTKNIVDADVPKLQSPDFHLNDNSSKIGTTDSSSYPIHSTPTTSRKGISFQTPDSEEKFLRNARTLRKNRQPFKQPDFLCSQVTSSSVGGYTSRNRETNVGTNPVKVNHSHLDGSKEDSDDFVEQPLKKKRLSPQESGNSFLQVEDEFFEDEAEESGGCKSTEEGDGYEYDYADSFINDNSVLTQHVSVGCNVESETSVVADQSSMKMGMYLRSLRSPDTLFSKKNPGTGNQYRLAFSQRYKYLNKYMKKAGIKASPSAYRIQRNSKKKRGQGLLHEESEESEESEAEEVVKITDDPELTDSQEMDEYESEERNAIMAGYEKGDMNSTSTERREKKRRVHFLSDSEEERSMLKVLGNESTCSSSPKSKGSNLTVAGSEPILLQTSSSSSDNSSSCGGYQENCDKNCMMKIAELVDQGGHCESISCGKNCC